MIEFHIRDGILLVKKTFNDRNPLVLILLAMKFRW